MANLQEKILVELMLVNNNPVDTKFIKCDTIICVVILHSNKNHKISTC